MSFATKWMQLETIIHCEISQSPKDKKIFSPSCDNSEYKKYNCCEIDILEFDYCIQPLSICPRRRKCVWEGDGCVCTFLLSLPDGLLSLWSWIECCKKWEEKNGEERNGKMLVENASRREDKLGNVALLLNMYCAIFYFI